MTTNKRTTTVNNNELPKHLHTVTTIDYLRVSGSNNSKSVIVDIKVMVFATIVPARNVNERLPFSSFDANLMR
jgi:hypothetical protein